MPSESEDSVADTPQAGQFGNLIIAWACVILGASVVNISIVELEAYRFGIARRSGGDRQAQSSFWSDLC